MAEYDTGAPNNMMSEKIFHQHKHLMTDAIMYDVHANIRGYGLEKVDIVGYLHNVPIRIS